MRGPILLAIAVVLVAACGLGPSPDPARASGTGIAPWTDRGPVTVCDGSQVLAPPASQPGGLCASASASPTSCTASSDCRDREACVCGRCTIAFCAVSSDCEAPRICNFSQQRCDLPCSMDADCGDAEDCISSVCRGRCATDADCQRGEHCDSGHVCSSTDCSDATSCRTGDACDLQRTPRQVLEPAPIADGDRIVLYLDLADPATPEARAIWRATSRDGSHFTLDPGAPILADARAPSPVVTPNGAIDLVVETAAGIAVASSSDGITFGTPTVVLAGDLHAPTAVHTGDQVVVYYETMGAIGMATGSASDTAVLVDHGLVLAPTDVVVGDGTPGTAFWVDIATLTSPHAILSGPVGAQTMHLWFAGFGQESSVGTRFGTPAEIPANFSIGFAAADPALPGELYPWPYGPVADRVEAFLDHREELGPAVVEREGAMDRGDRFLLYYVAATPATGATGAGGPFVVGRLGYLGSGTP